MMLRKHLAAFWAPRRRQSPNAFEREKNRAAASMRKV
jgi:hypothetical protein